jgi:undecaprenyl-diphosphatase
MDLFSALLLGLVQGLTEFLPVSSSGHLVLAQHLLGWEEPRIFFDVCLHIGTFAAVLAIFWKDVLLLAGGAARLIYTPSSWRRRGLDNDQRGFLMVVVGTVPIVVLGLLARDVLEQIFASVLGTSINLLITGTFLWFTRYTAKRGRTVGEMDWLDAVIVGCAQAAALMPGISRSGASIAAGLFCGLEREWAARYAFLLFVPAVTGALILELSHVEVSQVHVLPTLLGAVVAAVSGYLAL